MQAAAGTAVGTAPDPEAGASAEDSTADSDARCELGSRAPSAVGTSSSGPRARALGKAAVWLQQALSADEQMELYHTTEQLCKRQARLL